MYQNLDLSPNIKGSLQFHTVTTETELGNLSDI